MRSGSVLVTLRLSPRDRALLEQLVALEQRELAARGAEATLSSVMRGLIRDAARVRGVGDDDERAASPATSAARRWGPREKAAAPKVSQGAARALLRKRMGEKRGLGAELARRLGVEPAQVSRFKKGKEAFPASKLDSLYALLSEH